MLFILGLLCSCRPSPTASSACWALIVASCVVAAVLVPLARSGWAFGSFDLGF